MKKFFIVIIGVLICFSGCKKGGQEVEQTLRVGYIPSTAASQLFVGVVKGYFKDEGLKVEMSEFQTGADIVTALRGKSLDIGSVAIFSLVSSRANGVKLKSVGGATFDGEIVRSSHVMLPLDSEIQSVQDLKGKRIAVIAEGTQDYFMLLNYLKTNGIEKEDVEIISLPYQDMFFALANKNIDAAATAEPFVTMGIVEKKTKKLGYYFPYKTTELVTTIAHEDFIDENPELLAKFLKAVERATDFINTEKEEYRKLLPTLGEYGIKFKLSKDVADTFTVMGFKNAVTPAGIEDAMNVLIENNVLKTKMDAEDFIYSPK